MISVVPSKEPREFLIFSHAFDGPDLYGALSFFETMPSRPSLQMALNISTPSPSRAARKKARE
jgi:hypothetical protein